MQLIIFYIFAAVMLFAATMVITTRNPVHSALFLVLAFFNAAAIWLFAEAEFLAITLVVVYVGAVMVLFLFVVMMLDINVTPLREGFARYLPIGFAIALVMVLQMILVVTSDHIYQVADGSISASTVENTRQLGAVLYTTFVYPFELAACALLVAIIAAIMLTHRRRPGTKLQNPAQQVRVRPEDRVRLVKQMSESSKLPVEDEK